ncbi:MAG: DUF6089 family protein [Flavobacterium sp.]
MKKILVLFFCLIFHAVSTAQIHEIGVFLGGSNFIGDVGKTNYVDPNHLAFGVLYKWNKSPRHSYRFSYTQSTITGKDLDSEVPARYQRGYDFKNHIKEFTAGLEFNFLDFNLHESLKRKITPYVFSGVSCFIYDELFVVNGVTDEDYRASAFAIPMTVGVKGNILENFVLGLEVGARYTFTDNLDGSSPKNENLQSLRFGNLNSKDWYVFTGITLTYTFGEKPCYCAD